MVKLLSGVTVGELVVERPGRARVFEKLGIDYCCGGKRPLTEACRTKGLDVTQVVRQLEADDAGQGNDDRDWSKAALGELADHIEGTHHRYLKEELPPLQALARKVAAVHGEAHPELTELYDVVVGFRNELESHMLREEAVLFPLCRQLESGAVPEFLCHGTIQAPIAAMVREHEDAGDALAKMRTLTADFTPPPGACNSYRALFDRLATLERDMHQHVHKENNILFPRAVQAEAKVRHA